MAVVTLVANNFYLPGCVALINSLHRVQTILKIYVIVTKHVDTNNPDYIYLSRISDIIVVDDWPDDIHSLDKMGDYKLGNNTSFLIHKSKEFNPNNNFLKLRMWEIFDKKYEKMLYLDADVIVLQNIDHLLSCFHDIPFAAACDINKDDIKKIDKLNSGVFLFTPCIETYKKMFEMYRERILAGKIFDRTDQSLLEEFFCNWNHLSASYNTVWWRQLVLPINLDTTKILHFTMQKPWDEKETFPDEMKHMVDLWKSFYHPLWYFFDYDGTLTPNDSAEIPTRIISCLHDLKHNRYKKICIVTGRGFAFARTFIDILPIDAVICENGALLYEKIDHEVKMTVHEDAIHNHHVLELLPEEYLTAVSTDQHCRMYDVAIDLHKLTNEVQINNLEVFCTNNDWFYSRSNRYIYTR
jgi:lipopolysaccharide biosynthesis glycosyltransferase